MKYKHLFLTITFLSNILLAGFAQEPIRLEHGGGVRTVAFSPVNSQLVASAGEDNTIKLWNLRKETARTLKGHTDVINSIAFSPNGRLLASVSHDRTIKLWNVHNQQNVATLREGTQFRTIAFSPDGKLLATGGWIHVKLWNVGRRTEIATLQHDQPVQTVAFSSDGAFLAVGDGSRDGAGTVKVWNMQEQQVIATLQDDLKFVRAVTFSSDNRILATSSYNGEVKVWDVLTWELLHTIPGAGDYDIAFSPDEKMIAGTGNGYVNLWWVEDGTNVARLTGPAGWMHPVNFSHDGTSLAVGGEDGIVRIWRINTSLAEGRGDGVRILHIDTYLQLFSDANSANADNIPEPIPPPAVVREFFELDPFYEQWINVGGLPVIASAKVNPYALKEAAWLIEKMIGHRPDVLRSMVSNKARFSVIAHTEIIAEIPEYRDHARVDFMVYRSRGWGGSEGATVTSSEESILAYPGEVYQGYSLLLHEFAHGIHLLGLNTLDPTFNERLKITYEGAMKNGLWQGTYAASDEREYWAEGTHAWFYPNGPSSFSSLDPTHHSSRQALKKYDPELATLLAEVYGDREWRYTPVTTRTHLPHFQGFDPQNSPTFQGWPELKAIYKEFLEDPSSDGNGRWVNLKPYDPSMIPGLNTSTTTDSLTLMSLLNYTETDLLIYEIDENGMEWLWTRCRIGEIRTANVRMNRLWLIKDINGKNVAVFRPEGEVARAILGTPPEQTNLTPQDADLSLEKITGPWLWMIAPTKVTQGGANSINMDSLAAASGGVLTETDVARNGAREGDAVGNYVWTLGEVFPTGGNNVHNLLNNIGLGRRDMDDHSSYALITLESATTQSNVTMRAGSNDAIKIWLNGEVVHNNPINRESDGFQDEFKVNLKKGDNLLLVKVSEREGDWSMFVGVDADVNAVYKRPADPVVSEDVNRDGLVNILDLVSVSSNFGKTGENIADVNGDGIVNIVDLVKVAGEMGAGAAAPAAHSQTLEMLTAADVQLWLIQAQHADLTDAISQRGILMLQQLLTALIPKETLLLPNYPNPFNPETWIPYQLAEPANVSIFIYSADGHLIRTLDLEHKTVGMYHSKSRAVYWDGRNQVGEQVASGVYFYTLTAGDFSATRKMLILK